MIQKLKSYRNIGIALLMALTFNACMDDAEPDFEMVGDVYVVKKLVDDEVKYATAYYAYGNVGMSSATVTLPNGGGIVQLNGASKSLTFLKEPSESDFTSTPPVEGNYLFDATSSNNIEYQSSDALELDDLEIPEIDTIEFTNGAQALHISWYDVTGADGYFIKLLDSDGDAIFNSYSIASDENEYSIIPGASGQWGASAIPEEAYTIQLHAFTFDADANQTNSVYNIQEVSIGVSEVIWE